MIVHFKNILAFLLAIVLFVFCLNFVLDNPYIHQIVRKATLAFVEEKKYPFDLDFDEVNWGIFPLRLDLYNVKLKLKDQAEAKQSKDKSPQNFESYRTTMTHLRLGFSWLDLFLGDSRLSLQLDSADLGFRSTIATNQEKKLQGVLWPVKNLASFFKKIELRNSKIQGDIVLDEVHGYPQAYSFLTAGLNLDIKLKNAEDYSAQITLDRLESSLDKEPWLSLSELSISAQCLQSICQSSKLLLKGSSLDLNGSFRIDLLFDKDKTRLMGLHLMNRAKSVLDVVLLGQLLKWQQTKGFVNSSYILTSSLSFSDKPSKFRLTLDLISRDAVLSDIKLFQSKARIKIDSDKLFVEEATIIKDNKKFGYGHGTIHFDDPGSFDFEIKAKGAPLSGILEAFSVSFDVLDFGLFSPKLHIFGTGMPFSLKIKADVELSQIVFPSLKEVKSLKDNSDSDLAPTCRMKADLHFTKQTLFFNDSSGVCFVTEKSYQAESFLSHGSIKAPEQSHAVSALKISRYIDLDHGLAHMTVSSADMDSSLFNVFLPTKFSGKGSVKVDIDSSENRGPKKNNLDDSRTRVLSSFSFSKMLWKDFFLGKTSGHLTVEDEPFKISWDHVRLNWSEHSFLESKEGSFFIKEKKIQVKAKSKNLPLSISSFLLRELGRSEVVDLLVEDLDLDLEMGIAPLKIFKTDLFGLFKDIHFAEEKIADDLRFKLHSNSSQNWTLNDFYVKKNSSEWTAKASYQVIPLKKSLVVPRTGASSFLAKKAVEIGLNPDDLFSIEFSSVTGMSNKFFLEDIPFLSRILKEREISS
ncbi:MAG: hypothetical protein KA436_04990, partial [Oligoflexales bacterium]|nr:hypothetical protein [Oligoflexales bacterium]